MNAPKTALNARDLSALETRERIVVAARVVFRSKGFDKASMRDIIQEAGLSGAGVAYHHFRSKEAIVKSILEEEVTRAFAVVSDKVGADGRFSKLLNVTGADMRKWTKACSDDMFLDLWPQLSRHEEFKTFFDETRVIFDTRIRASLEKGVADGVFDANLDIEEAVATLPMLWHGMRMRQMVDPKSINYDKTAVSMRRLYRALLRPTALYPLQDN